MPDFAFLTETPLDLSMVARRLEVQRFLGSPYDDAEIAGAEADARRQMAEIAASLRRDGVQLDEAVRWISEAGGQAVIAHPARYRLTRSKLRRLITAFADAGGIALEVVSGSHSRDECYAMARHAREFGLLASAGSDYHGPENPWVELGQLPDLPLDTRPIWNDWAEAA